MSSSRSKKPEENARGLTKGDCVHLSELGFFRHPRYVGKEGTVVGRGSYPSGLRVVWGNARSPITMHTDYLELVKKVTRNAEGGSRHPQRR
jgi:hypothetical protein